MLRNRKVLDDGCPAVSFIQYDGERVTECQKREDRQGPLCCPNRTASTRGVVQHLVESGRSVSHSKTRDTGKVVGVQSSDRLSDELKLWVRATEVPKYRVLRKTEVLSSRSSPCAYTQDAGRGEVGPAQSGRRRIQVPLPRCQLGTSES